MFVWGSAGSGCIGVSDLEDRDTPSLWDADLEVDDQFQFVCSGMHTLACKASEPCLWGWGDNQYHQIDDGGESVYPLPRRIDFFQERHVKIISCGWTHTVVILQNEQIFSWGLGKHYQLGHGTSDNVSCPKLVDITEHSSGWSQVSCGWKHTLLLSEDGQVFGWGTNRHTQICKTRQKFYKQPTKLTTLLNDEGLNESIIQIKASWRHSLHLVESGRIFSSGCNRFGQLGVPENDNSSRFVTAEDGKELTNIIQIDCGWFHGVGLCSQGYVWSWGKGTLGELGCLDPPRNSFTALKVAGLPEPIVDIVCGSAHTFALTSNNQVFGWGWNEHGNISNVEQYGQIISQPLRILPECEYRRIVSGGASVLMYQH